MKIKEQTRKLATGCLKHCFEVADKADVVWRDFRRVSEPKNNPQSFDRGFLFIIKELD